MTKRIFVALSLAFFFGLGLGCARNESPTLSEEQVQPEIAEHQVKKKNIDLRNETDSKMMKGEYLHDGPSILASVGDIESVPALLVVLEEYPPSSDGGMVCSADHALDALKKITGADPGFSHKAWSDWWVMYKKQNKISSRLEKE